MPFSFCCFFSYGRILELSADFGHIRHRYLLLASGGLFAAGVYWSIATRVDLRNITSFLNAAAIVLVAIPLVNILAYSFRSETPSIGEVVDKSVRPTDLGTLPADLGTLPDIYYIILDAYASSQNLKGNFGFDNQQFTDFLTEKGFYIAPESHSNYTNTTLSLASSLNIGYLDYLADVIPGDSKDPSVLIKVIQEDRVSGFLRSQGYQIVHFRTLWESRKADEDGDGDLYFGCEKKGLAGIGENEFILSLVGQTLLEPFLSRIGVTHTGLYSKFMCELSNLAKVAKVDGPKFVFTHVSAPHPPFVIDRNGERVPDSSTSLTQWASKDGYINQLIYVNKMVMEGVEAILSETSVPPIIIIQGDHGTWFLDEPASEALYRERLGILNAYSLPGGGNDLLYDSITPVNTFRLVFASYFDVDLDLLDDRSYYTDMDKGWFNYLDVTDAVR